MKLWQKVFLTTLALLVVTTGGLSLLFLKSGNDELWAREYERAAARQQALAGLVKTLVVSERLRSGQLLLSLQATSDTALAALESQQPDDYLLAFRLKGPLGPLGRDLTGLVFLSELWDMEPDPALTYRQVIVSDGRTLLALNMPLELERQTFRLCCVYDVSALAAYSRSQTLTALAFCLAASLAGALALLVLVRWLLRPLATLSQVSRRIAQGNYGERVELTGRDELASLARDMNRMAGAVQSRVEQLEQASEDQKTFIANMAHELKTPLTSILGFADLLYIQKDVPAKQRMEYAGIIKEETLRMRALSGKLMELLTVGSQNLDFRPQRLEEVVDEVAAAMQPVLAAGSMVLQHACAPSLWVRMDRELFKSLLYNILDNARKASPEGSTIKLLARETEGRAELLIRDYGQGIPQKALDKVLQPFYMVDKSRSRKAGGAGLGLALCQEIARIHGGQLSIDSRVGQGTLVTLRFDLTEPGPPPAPPKED